MSTYQIAGDHLLYIPVLQQPYSSITLCTRISYPVMPGSTHLSHNGAKCPVLLTQENYVKRTDRRTWLKLYMQ